MKPLEVGRDQILRKLEVMFWKQQWHICGSFWWRCCAHCTLHIQSLWIQSLSSFDEVVVQTLIVPWASTPVPVCHTCAMWCAKGWHIYGSFVWRCLPIAHDTHHVNKTRGDPACHLLMKMLCTCKWYTWCKQNKGGIQSVIFWWRCCSNVNCTLDSGQPHHTCAMCYV